MSYYEDRINEFLNGRAFMTLQAVVLVACSLLAYASGRFESIDTGNGVFFSLAANYLIPDARVSLVVNMAALLAIAFSTIVLNKVYNFVRSVTFIGASVFLLLMMANPFVCTQLNAGTVLLLVAVVSMFVMFSTYQRKGTSQRSVYIIFALLSLCCMFQYAFIVLVVTFVVGLLMMRGIDFRGIIAMLLGLATPFWIGLGLGLVDVHTAMLPEIETIWKQLQGNQMQLVIASTAVVAVLAVVLMITNMFTILNYRLQIRVYNSFFLVLTVVAIGMMCIDYRNMMIYVPLLNWCLAIQVAHAFTINNTLTRRYVPVLLLIAGAWAIYVAHIIS